MHFLFSSFSFFPNHIFLLYFFTRNTISIVSLFEVIINVMYILKLLIDQNVLNHISNLFFLLIHFKLIAIGIC
jgi:hypothetical protein